MLAGFLIRPDGTGQAVLRDSTSEGNHDTYYELSEEKVFAYLSGTSDGVATRLEDILTLAMT